MLDFPLLLLSMDQIHFPFLKQGTFTNELTLFHISLLVCSKSKGKSSMGSTWRRGSFAYNTIPTAEEVLNGDVYCTLSD
jgi:hypothetical protein